jgi:NADH:ubiquinone oxidoreductase subunit 5 (subunit L)/multisubunit Na+/H+ antiporter MnhA subunit
MIMNRIGDMGLILAMFITYDMFNTLQFYTIFNSINAGYQKYYDIFTHNISGYELISILFLIGAVGKSAQIGLHT